MAGQVSLAIILAYLVIGACAPLLAPHDPLRVFPGNIRKPPGAEFPLGTDEVGRDILSRLIFGARVSIEIGVLSVGTAALCGSALGLVAGYAGGSTDAWIMRLVDILLAFPGILLAIAIVAVLGPGFASVIIAVGIEALPAYARTVRASTRSVREAEYILAARALGAPARRIVGRHILPGVLAPVIVLASLGVGIAVLTAAALSFVGIGAQPPTAEWGSMLATGRAYLRDAPWIAASPGLAVVVLTLALNLFGDALRDALDPHVP
jgi:peptide/nickel transport system permease protein